MLHSRCGLLLVLCISPLASLTSPCPAGCCCPHAGYLVLCESLGLRSLPRSVPLSTSALSVARNQLCNVDHRLSALSGLQELSLSHNLLSRLPRGLPPSLESLQLQENRIAYITSGALRQLGNLTRLDLEDNRIRVIPPGALRGLNKLRVLSLKGNKLTNIPLNLPPSLTHLDLSENCISVLDPSSLSALVNLQNLKINSNCLRSVPESTFHSLPRLKSLDLNNNLWVCQCEILYLHRWLLSGQVRMATDVLCTEPIHLVHRLLRNLSVGVLCPHHLRSNGRTHKQDFNSTMDETLETPSARQGGPKSFGNMTHLGNSPKKVSQESTFGVLSKDVPHSHILHGPYSLQTITYEECSSLNKTQSFIPNHLKTTTPLPAPQQKCRDNTTGHCPYTNTTSAAETQPMLSTNRDAPRPIPNPRPHTQLDSAVVISLLAVLCVLTVLLTLAVLLVLKKVLLHQQRVAPLDVGAGR